MVLAWAGTKYVEEEPSNEDILASCSHRDHESECTCEDSARRPGRVECSLQERVGVSRGESEN